MINKTDAVEPTHSTISTEEPNPSSITYTPEDRSKIRQAFSSLIQATWDGDWSFNRKDRPNKHRDLLISYDLWPTAADEDAIEKARIDDEIARGLWK